MRFLLAAVIFLMAAAFTFPGESVSVKAEPKFSLRRSDIRLTARVEPDPDNRMLRLIIEGPQYMAQDEQLEGEDAPKVRQRWFKSVPPGNYTAVAVLFRAGGQELVARDEFCVIGPEVECTR
jgi:hypothetical protein